MKLNTYHSSIKETKKLDLISFPDIFFMRHMRASSTDTEDKYSPSSHKEDEDSSCDEEDEERKERVMKLPDRRSRKVLGMWQAVQQKRRGIEALSCRAPGKAPAAGCCPVSRLPEDDCGWSIQDEEAFPVCPHCQRRLIVDSFCDIMSVSFKKAVFSAAHMIM